MAPRPKHTSRSRRRSRRATERTELQAAAPRLTDEQTEAFARLALEVDGETADIVAVEELGGDPSEGTDKDKRLKANKPAASTERDQLDAIREALTAPMEQCAECDHAFSDHSGTDGACAMDACDCEGFVAAAAQSEGASVVIESPGHSFGFEVLPGDGIDEVLNVIRVQLEGLQLVADASVEAPEAEVLPAPNGAAPAITPAPDGGPSGELRWVANIVPEATLTDDGRAMAPGALTWRELPLTLMAMTETSEGGHVGAEVAGRIDSIFRDGDMLKATGVFAPTDYGQLIGKLVGDGTLRGVSVDLAIHQYEVGPRSDYFDEDGNWLTERPATAENEEPPSLVDLLFGDEVEDAIFVVTEAVIGAVTVCPFQAFADANISLAAGGAPAVWTVAQQAGYVVTQHHVDAVSFIEAITAETLTASAAGLAPEAPPAAWFDDPELTELTALTVDEEGRIFGHAAAWDTCHLGIPDVCTTAPESETNYAYFLLKEVLCADGERVPCGTITLETGHADRSLGRGDATAHYDNTGLAVADVNVGEDEHGIWVAGALRPDTDAEKARELRGAVLSGDWRSVNGNLELVALLAVNVPGFPVPRARALVASGEDGSEVLALVAAGITIGADPGTGSEFSPIQAEKIRVFEAIASGRLASLRDRAAGVLTADEAQEAPGFTAEAEAPEAPAEEPTEPPAEPVPAEPVDDDPDQAEG